MLIEPLLLTIFLECIVLLILGERDKTFYLYWGAVTAFTNLSINVYISLIFSGSLTEYYIAVAFLEVLVLVIEFLLCLVYTNDKGKSIKYSAVCNLTSFLIGLVLLPIF